MQGNNKVVYSHHIQSFFDDDQYCKKSEKSSLRYRRSMKDRIRCRQISIEIHHQKSEAKNEKPRKIVVELKEIWGHLAFTSNFPVNHDMEIKAINGLLVKTASKSQQDKTIIIEYDQGI